MLCYPAPPDDVFVSICTTSAVLRTVHAENSCVREHTQTYPHKSCTFLVNFFVIRCKYVYLLNLLENKPHQHPLAHEKNCSRYQEQAKCVKYHSPTWRALQRRIGHIAGFTRRSMCSSSSGIRRKPTPKRAQFSKPSDCLVGGMSNTENHKILRFSNTLERFAPKLKCLRE